MKNLKLLLLYFTLLFSPFYLLGKPVAIPKGVYTCDEKYRNHPGDYPFPTEMSFMVNCDHKITFLIDSFDPDLVKEGDTVFVLDWYLPWFVRNVHPKISHRYILVCNDTDGWHPDPGSTRELLHDPKVAAWFCKNFILSNHPKLFQIPIGPNIMYWDAFHEEYEKGYLKSLVSQKNIEKKHLIFLNITVRNDGHRPIIYNTFKDKSFVFFKEVPIQRITFWDDLASSKFVFCPPGIGLDTVRHWEAFLLNTIPVIAHTPLDDLYKGLPYLFIDRWEDITEEFLNQKYMEIQNKIAKGELSTERAFFDYWWNKIQEAQKLVRKNKWDNAALEKTKWDQGTINALNEIFLENPLHGSYQLFMYGHNVGLRSIQMTHHFTYFDRVVLSDMYAYDSKDSHISSLQRYAQDHSLFNNSNKLQLFNKNDFFHKLCENRGQYVNTRVFMDLTYHRFDFKKDLDTYFDLISPGMIISGNMIEDQYVMDQLNKFASERKQKLKTKDKFWYFIKR